MNPIGVFICNYNGKEWVIRCIESLKKQSVEEFDVYVVDNASTDGSVNELERKYGNNIKILKNSENLGGAGGFDRALKTGIEYKYSYVVLLDNDIELEEHTIENMWNYLEEHQDVGIVGSKVMIMDEPDTIQDFGCSLDFSVYKEKPCYCGRKEDNEIPSEYVCDYVPTCAVMARTSMLEVSGTMPADNFIYYDDIELSYKMSQNGYRVVALGSAKVWHKGGFRKAVVSTFPKYYFLRNRLNFFAKYVDEGNINHFIDTMLEEVFSQFFGYHTKNMKEMFLAVDFAFNDFLQGKRGKAADNRIMQLENRNTPFENCIFNKKHICIELINNFVTDDELDIFRILHYLTGIIQLHSPQTEIAISLAECDYTEEIFFDLWQGVIHAVRTEYMIPEFYIADKVDDEKFDLILKLCPHVKHVRQNELPKIWIDRYANCITSESEYHYITCYEENEKFFKGIYRPLMQETVERIRNKQ